MIVSMSIIITILVILGIVWVGAAFFIIFRIGKFTVKNNPDRALIYIKNGLNIDKVFKGKMHQETNEGYSYAYNNGNIIIVPKSYKEVYFKNNRMIFASEIGQIIATPFENDITLDEKEKASLIYAICSSHVGSDGIKALRGRPAKLSIIMVAVIAFIVGAVATVGFNKFQEYQAQQPTAIEQPVNKNTPVEVK